MKLQANLKLIFSFFTSYLKADKKTTWQDITLEELVLIYNSPYNINNKEYHRDIFFEIIAKALNEPSPFAISLNELDFFYDKLESQIVNVENIKKVAKEYLEKKQK